jgi:hypothetical protein
MHSAAGSRGDGAQSLGRLGAASQRRQQRQPLTTTHAAAAAGQDEDLGRKLADLLVPDTVPTRRLTSSEVHPYGYLYVPTLAH